MLTVEKDLYCAGAFTLESFYHKKVSFNNIILIVYTHPDLWVTSTRGKFKKNWPKIRPRKIVYVVDLLKTLL